MLTFCHSVINVRCHLTSLHISEARNGIVSGAMLCIAMTCGIEGENKSTGKLKYFLTMGPTALFHEMKGLHCILTHQLTSSDLFIRYSQYTEITLLSIYTM